MPHIANIPPHSTRSDPVTSPDIITRHDPANIIPRHRFRHDIIKLIRRDSDKGQINLGAAQPREVRNLLLAGD